MAIDPSSHRHHAKLTPIDVLALFVLDQKLLGEASEWWPFVDSLPRTFTTPVFLRRKVVESLPKDLREDVQTGITFIQRTFLKLKVLLGGHVEEEPEVQCLSTGFTVEPLCVGLDSSQHAVYLRARQ
ncbi:hypothetical protein HPB47_001154 [Ixodes persulcatus]|uniref:Uncharacterized protein n=1 Tax=Ixodes persulcatus TaxID=34615 RepID=A0AC60PPV0_IXOPE|nr:hypothetical protein HPB47_001154 [Ixodes persulcatus]